VESQKRGFQFTYPKSSSADFTFSGPSNSSTIKCKSEELCSSNPFVFGENLGEPPKVPKREKKESGKAKFRPKLTRHDGQTYVLFQLFWLRFGVI